MEPLAVFFIFIILAVFIRLAAGGMDGDRVEKYIRSKGGKLLDKRWSPFGRGWVGEKNARIYEVRYRDRQGNTHAATVKTSMLSGVYFTEDKIVLRASRPSDNSPSSPSDDLVAENERLRRRLAELEDRGRF